MLFRSLLPLGLFLALAGPALPQSTAFDVVRDMVAYVKMPAPLNPKCNHHVVNMSMTITDRGVSYAAATKLFTAVASQTPAGSRVPYNIMATSKFPLVMREFSAGNITPADRMADASFGWPGDKTNVLGTIAVNLAKGQRKTYTMPANLRVTTIAAGNKYLLSGVLPDGPAVAIYLEKGAFTECR